MAVAESVTAGLLKIFFCGFKDGQKFFQGGITTYNIGQKYMHLQVEPIHAKDCNCVSEKVAEQMAMNVCGLFNSDWGIGITGYATAVKESGNKLYCFYAIAFNKSVIREGKIEVENMLPVAVQKKYVSGVIDSLVQELKKAEAPVP